jgi:hypothetical protein
MNPGSYVPNLKAGVRVRLVGPVQRSKSGELCTIIRILPNPSERAEHQWYDVRFDDGSLGRFLEGYLARTVKNDENAAA